MAVAILFTASCTKEDVSSSIGGGEVEVTFTADLGQLGTRAYGEGNNANRVYLGVYEPDSKDPLPLVDYQKGYPVTNGKATITVVLLKDKEYDLVFWAQHYVDNDADEVNDYAVYGRNWEDRSITVSYDDAVSQDDKRDAFFLVKENFKAGHDETVFELRRPFAQLRAGISQADYDYVKANGSDGIANSTAVVKGVANVLSLNDEVAEVYGDETVTFDAADVATGEDEKFTVNSADYYQLSMNYLLVREKTLVDVTYTFADGEANYTRPYYNVPVQRNYRTNIIGQLISSPMDFTVIIKPEFEGEHTVEVWDGQSVAKPAKVDGKYVIENPAELAWLAAAVNGTLTRASEPQTFLGETFVLASDINLGDELWTPIGRSSMHTSTFRGTFDGQGHTISGLKVQTETGAGLFGLVSPVAIKNLTIDGAEVSGNHYAGVLVAWIQGVDKNHRCAVMNCHAKNVKVAVTPDANHDNGDKAGALIGYAVRTDIDNCSVNNAEVSAYRDVAGLVGHLNAASALSNSSVANTEVVADQRAEYISVEAPNAGKVAGRVAETATIDNCTDTNVNVTIIYSTPAEVRTETINITESGNYVFDNLTVSVTDKDAVQIAEGIEATITLVGNVVVESKAGSAIAAKNATLTLVGGNLTAKGNGNHAFGIGGNGATVTLDGVTVEYVCGGHIQPLCVNDPKYGKSEPEGGAAIGGAVVNILNSTIKKADGGSKAAAIGAQYWQDAVINIENSTILEANGGNASAGIGGSRYTGDSKYNLEINIKNSNVTATGGQFGAGIGSGYDTHCNQQGYTATNEINIDATSTVKATGGKYAAGIGTGYHSAYLTGAIAAGANVTAVSGDIYYKDAYTTAQNIGYGVVDPAREFSGANTNVTFTVAGEVIAAPTAKAMVDSADALKAAIDSGKTTILLKNGTDYDLNGIQKDGLTLIGWGEGVEIANTTKYASGKSIGAIWKAINLKNMTITNTVYTMADGSNATFEDVTFAAGFRQGYGKGVVFTNCTFGSNSEGYALHFQTDSASEGGVINLTGCNFNGGKVHLGGKRAYAFSGCEFATGTDFQVWSNISLENCTVGGVAVTASNMATLFPNLDAAKVTLK